MTQPTRRVFCIGIGALNACGFASETSETPPADADIAVRQPNESVSGDGFAFGPADSKGLSLGLRVENKLLRRGEKVRYHVALRNQGGRRANRGLYRSMARPRIHLILCAADGRLDIVGAAISDTLVVTTPTGIDMSLEAGQTLARPGTPLVVDAEGEVELYLLFGGRPFFDFDQVSGVVKIEVMV